MSGIQIIKSGGATVSAYLKLAGGVALSSSLVSVVDQTDNVSPLQLATASIGLNAPTFLALPTWTNTLGTKTGFNSQQTVAVASVGTGVFKIINSSYTINNTAAQTGTITGFLQNATETALNGITHNLMDLQVGGVSQFKVSRIGAVTALGIGVFGNLQSTGYVAVAAASPFVWSSRIYAYAPSDGVLLLQDNANTSFGRLQLGGTTSSFPSIKRNGAAIEFRVADDSAFCDISTSRILFPSNSGSLAANELKLAGYATITFSTRNYIDGDIRGVSFGGAVSMAGSNVAAAASAQLDVSSTTKGFLMPRMTQAQILAIATPANGLEVYNTDLAQPCFYDGTGWRKVTHTNM